MEKNVVIVNYNTPELTTAAIRSLQKNTPDCKITVFDNSDKGQFKPMKGVTVLYNDRGQMVDFNAVLDKYPNKGRTYNDFGSAKHTMSVDYLMDMFPEGFVLMDSDVLVKKDVSDFFDNGYAYVGEEREFDGKDNCGKNPRLLPFLCYINSDVCRKAGVGYFDGERCWKLKTGKNAKDYDTGASFLEDCKKNGLSGKQMKLDGYIIHFGRGSYGDKDSVAWLKENRELYENDVKNLPEATKDKILVVIPYFAGGTQGRELEYAVAGWRKHFKEDFQIVLVGDYHPVVDTGDDITFIECPRIDDVPGEYRAHLDHVHKFKKVMDAYPDMKGFIYTCDDIYAVNDFDMVDVLVLKEREREISATLDSPNAWRRNNAKTKQLLIKEGLPTRNFVCHLPVYYEKDKLLEIYDRYDCEHNSYVVEQLYFNTYFRDRIPLHLNIDFDNYKCGINRPNPRLRYIERAFKEKVWITNSVEGWIPALDRMLADYYNL